MRRFPPFHGRLLATVALGLAACGGNEYAPPPPPTVTVQQPEIRDVVNYAEYTGTTRAVESVEVRARVKGFLVAMHFTPGEFVKKDAPLFTIDPEPFEVALAAARADLASNQAERDLAQTTYERTQALYQNNATSELNLVRVRAERDKAAAAVAAARSAVRQAELDLEYAHVKAPTSGRVGRHLVDVGNLVGADGATILTEMVVYQPLYVYFHVSERDLIALQKQGRERRAAQGASYANRPPTPIYVAQAGEDSFAHEGVVDYTALEVDPNTGTFEVRGVLQNEGELDQIVIPGSFVRVRVPIGRQANALLVPESALGADQSGRYALVVNTEDVVEYRSIEVGPRIEGMRVVTRGLRAEDRVVVNGLQRARPGARVSPETAAPAGPEPVARAGS